MDKQATPPAVQAALALQPFKAGTTRRDLTTSLRAYKTAWAALEQTQVYNTACRRLGGRAAEVLVQVRRVLLEVDEAEKASNAGKVVVERSYEFRRETNSDGTSQAVQSGSTIFKIQSTILDLQAFATDFLAQSSSNRLTLLVDGLPAHQRKLKTLSSSLSTCISIYALFSLSTSTWAEEDAEDLLADEVALPRLFQLSIALRGSVYDAFLAAQPSPADFAKEPPAKRRTAFITWCLERNPLLRPSETSSPSAIRRGKAKVSWPPAEADAVALGVSNNAAQASPSPAMRRAVSQPVPVSVSTPSPTSFAPAALPPPPPPPATATAADLPLAPPTALATAAPTTTIAHNGAAAEQKAGEVMCVCPIDSLGDSDGSQQEDDGAAASEHVDELMTAEGCVTTSPPPEAETDPSPPLQSLANSPPSAALEPTEASVTSSPLPTTVASAVSTAFVKPTFLYPDDEPDLSMARRDSSASSIAMTVTSSAGSRLFESSLGVQEEESGEEEEEGADVGEMVGEVAGKAAGEETESVQISEELTAGPNRQLTEVAKVGELEEGKSVEKVEEEEDACDAKSATAIETASDSATAKVDEQPSTIPVITFTEEPGDLEALSPSSPIDNPPSPLRATSPAASNQGRPCASPYVECAPPSTPPSITVPAFPAPSVAAPPSSPPTAPYRILALDGGGLVGPIPQLFLLKQYLSSLPPSPSPSQHFDLITGTSSSSILAILLGHCKLSVDAALRGYLSIAQAAFALEPPSTRGARKPKRGMWSRLLGRGASPLPQCDGLSEAVRRERALDAALKAHLPRFDEPFAARVGEAVKASLAASSLFPSSSRWTGSRTSLSPAAASITFATLHASNQPIHLLSLGTGYSSLPLDALAAKRISKSRLIILREIKQLAASNTVAAEALIARLEGDEAVQVERIEVDCSRCGIVGREEWEIEAMIRAVVRGGVGEATESGASILSSPPSAPSSPSTSRLTSVPLLSPTSPTSPTSSSSPSTTSPVKSLRKRASRLSFFTSLGNGNKSTPSPERRASSFVSPPSVGRGGGGAEPLSPLSRKSPLQRERRQDSLAPPFSERELRGSVSLEDLNRTEFGSKGMYGIKEGTGSTGSLRSG
ncbi:hypothetical protein JCM11641_001305 [Rhodosporidiobolus odoratus]